MAISETYKAVNIDQTGDPNVLTVKELPKPTVVPVGQILVKNFIAGVNFIGEFENLDSPMTYLTQQY